MFDFIGRWVRETIRANQPSTEQNRAEHFARVKESCDAAAWKVHDFEEKKFKHKY